jgi:hypothetical protein
MAHSTNNTTHVTMFSRAWSSIVLSCLGQTDIFFIDVSVGMSSGPRHAPRFAIADRMCSKCNIEHGAVSPCPHFSYVRAGSYDCNPAIIHKTIPDHLMSKHVWQVQSISEIKETD